MQNLKTLEYIEKDNAAIFGFVRLNVNTTWHSLGTCAMKPHEKGSAAHKNLSVYGVSALKVVCG